MGTFAQWQRTIDKGEVRRVTYVCGPQRALVHDVVAVTRKLIAPGELDQHTASGTDKDLWPQAFQHAMVAGGNRLLLIRDAEKISNWAPFTRWITGLRQLPGVHLLFVSNDDDVPRGPGGKRAAAAPHIEAMKPPRGYVVRCTEPAEDDAVAWVRARSPLDDNTARHLLSRVGGDLTAAAAVCAKLAVFGDVTVSTTVVDELVAARPGDDFVDSLLAGKKHDAFALIGQLGERDQLKVLGLLDQRLDMLTLLWESQAHNRYGGPVAGVNPFLVRRYTPMAKDYQPQRCAQRRQVLAVIDDAVRSGARDGIWEVLVALW